MRYHLGYHLGYCTVCEHAGELATGRLIVTHMGPSMLSRLDDVEHDCASDGLILRS